MGVTRIRPGRTRIDAIARVGILFGRRKFRAGAPPRHRHRLLNGRLHLLLRRTLRLRPLRGIGHPAAGPHLLFELLITELQLLDLAGELADLIFQRLKPHDEIGGRHLRRRQDTRRRARPSGRWRIDAASGA